MKALLVLIIISALASAALIGLVNLRKKEEDREQKRCKFHDVKLRVTLDVLGEYQDEKRAVEDLMEKTTTEMKALESEITNLQAVEKQKKDEEDACKGNKKIIDDSVGSLESQVNNINAELEKQRGSWKAETESLKQQLTQRSKVCNFVKTDSKEGRTLCGDKVIEPPKVEPPKAQPLNVQPPKADAPEVILV